MSWFQRLALGALVVTILTSGFMTLSPKANAQDVRLRVYPSVVSNMNFGDRWGDAARESHRFCQGRGFSTGFPVAEEGINNRGQRVVQIWCAG